jgi:hypothetical protein
MPDKTPAEIRLSSLSCRAAYARALIAEWENKGRFVQAVYDALHGWNPSLANVTLTPFAVNLAQTQVVIQLLQGRFAVQIGLEAISLDVWNPGWNEFDTVTAIVTRVVEAMHASCGVEIAKQGVTLELHVSPKGKELADLTSPFVPSLLSAVAKENFEAFGFSLHRNDVLWRIDLSAQFPKSLYLGIYRAFGSATPLDEIGAAVRADEVALLDLLGLSVLGLE